MASNLSVAQIVAGLEAQIAHHKAQVDVHTTQEELHRQKKVHHAAELEKLTGYLEEFRKTSEAILNTTEIRRVERDDQRPIDNRSRFGRLIAVILEDKEGDATFSATSLAREIEQRFGSQVDKARSVDPRSIGSQLRRMARRGEIHLTRAGQPHHEALYSKARPRG